MPCTDYNLQVHFFPEAYPNIHVKKSSQDMPHNVLKDSSSSQYLEVLPLIAALSATHVLSFLQLPLQVSTILQNFLHQFPSFHNFHFQYSNILHCMAVPRHWQSATLHTFLHSSDYNIQPSRSFPLQFQFLR